MFNILNILHQGDIDIASDYCDHCGSSLPFMFEEHGWWYLPNNLQVKSFSGLLTENNSSNSRGYTPFSLSGFNTSVVSTPGSNYLNSHSGIISYYHSTSNE